MPWPAPACCPSGWPPRGIVSGVGPIGDPEFDVGDGRRQPRHHASWPGEAPLALLPVFWFQEFAVRRWPEAALRAATKRFPAPDADDARTGRRRGLPSSTTPAVPRRRRRRPATQDFVLFARDWGFRLQDITVPVPPLARRRRPQRPDRARPLHGRSGSPEPCCTSAPARGTCSTSTTSKRSCGRSRRPADQRARRPGGGPQPRD